MKVFFLGLTLFLIFSCYNKKNEIDFFLYKSYPKIISTAFVKKNDLFLNKDTFIKRPPGTLVELALFETIENNFTKKKYCLFYKVPNKKKNKKGILKLTSMNGKNCGTSRKYVLAEIKEIEDLSIYFFDKDINIKKKKFKKGLFYFLIKKNDELRTISIPLLNYKKKKKALYQRYSLSFENALLKGVLISSPGPNLKKNEEVRSIGSYEDNYLDRTLKKCHQYNAKCEESMKFKCHECEFGWFQVISNNDCQEKSTKFCGQDQCGDRGMPACIRGSEAAKRMGLKTAGKCYKNSPAGFCSQGLKTVCDGEVLICL